MGVLQELKDKVLGTEKQNKEASERMKAEDAKNPDTTQAKVNKVLGYRKGGYVRAADGITKRGKTRGKIV
jgi:hypothetical protein